jgi:hypothetical protein
MVKSFEETLVDAKRAVDTVKAWTAPERHQYELGRAAGRAEGIREAMALVEREGGGWTTVADALRKMLTAPPPPAATCTCTCPNHPLMIDTIGCPIHSTTCGHCATVHAAAEKP